MIRFTLSCDHDHSFESWFPSGEAYERLRAGGQVTCPACGSSRIDKALMSPAVTPSSDEVRPLATDESRLARLKAEIEAKSEYVGPRFAAEARAIHEGNRPDRLIHGEAAIDEARALLEDGIPIAPLPFRSRRQVN
jgi:hypothetical protein